MSSFDNNSSDEYSVLSSSEVDDYLKERNSAVAKEEEARWLAKDTAIFGEEYARELEIGRRIFSRSTRMISQEMKNFVSSFHKKIQKGLYEVFETPKFRKKYYTYLNKFGIDNLRNKSRSLLMLPDIPKRNAEVVYSFIIKTITIRVSLINFNHSSDNPFLFKRPYSMVI
jgi:hypothetical protein